MTSLSASRQVDASRQKVFEFLSDLQNHWLLTDRFVEVMDVNGGGGVVRVRGPAGTRRTVETRVTAVENPSSIAGEARAGATLARVRWSLEGDDPTLVGIAITVEHASLPDRLLLGIGGGVWLRRRLDGVLETLERRVRDQAALR